MYSFIDWKNSGEYRCACELEEKSELKIRALRFFSGGQEGKKALQFSRGIMITLLWQQQPAVPVAGQSNEKLKSCFYPKACLAS